MNKDAIAAPTVAALPVPLTKEQRIAKLRDQIAKIEARITAIETGVEVKVSKAVVLPNVGDAVTFLYGRKTATTEQVLRIGTVAAVKPSSDIEGKKLPAQVKVQVGEGFDAEFVTIYPAQVLSVGLPEPTEAPVEE